MPFPSFRYYGEKNWILKCKSYSQQEQLPVLSQGTSTWDHQNYKGTLAIMLSEFLTSSCPLTTVAYAHALEDSS